MAAQLTAQPQGEVGNGEAADVLGRKPEVAGATPAPAARAMPVARGRRSSGDMDNVLPDGGEKKGPPWLPHPP